MLCLYHELKIYLQTQNFKIIKADFKNEHDTVIQKNNVRIHE